MEGFSFVSLNWLLWMAMTVAAFWALPSLRMRFLAFSSIAFLAVYDPVSALVLIVLTGFTYWVIRADSVGGRRAFLGVAVVFSVLLFYKVRAGNIDLGELGMDVLVPLGISYYTLRCIHLMIERYKGSVRVVGLEGLISYLFFLPTIWIGPIHRYPEFEKDRRRHRWDPELFSRGIERLIYGYAKVVLLANVLVNRVMVNWVASLDAAGLWLDTYLEMVRIGLTLYLLFSGFSDIAIGFAGLLGFKVMENFKFPYLQRNISDFWRTWHISLTSWSRDYVYTSVIAKTRKPWLGVIASLIVIALWHEVSLRYLLWGLYHGMGIVVWQQFRKRADRFPRVESRVLRSSLNVGSVVLTLHFVWLSFILVRQTDVASMISIVKSLLFLN